MEEYRLPDLWCLHLYTYEAEVQIGDHAFPIRPGYASIIPADTSMIYHFAGRCEHVYAHFRCQPGGERTPIPAMQEVGDRFAEMYRRLQYRFVATGLAQQQRDAALWDVLWELSDRPKLLASGDSLHPAVHSAMQRIEQQLAEPLTVAALARYSDVSYSYLSKLFQEATGNTVVGYIRNRRVQRAEHLLRNSTLPIKSIAAAVGIPDLHLFNKVIHRALGASPSGVRGVER